MEDFLNNKIKILNIKEFDFSKIIITFIDTENDSKKILKFDYQEKNNSLLIELKDVFIKFHNFDNNTYYMELQWNNNLNDFFNNLKNFIMEKISTLNQSNNKKYNIKNLNLSSFENDELSPILISSLELMNKNSIFFSLSKIKSNIQNLKSNIIEKDNLSIEITLHIESYNFVRENIYESRPNFYISIIEK
jgi:hypothetical protein